MNKREDYEHLELDNDKQYYWFMNKDVEYYRKTENKRLNILVEWFYVKENEAKWYSLFYKGTRVYFTYNNKKYYISWTFQGDYILEFTKKIEKEGCTNIQINWGELD